MASPASLLERNAQVLAATLPPLLVEAERVAATVAAGAHGRRRVGPGETFWQFRRYQPGDPVSAIDWRQSAKTQPLFVREAEWTAAQTVWLWCDASPSMRWRSHADLPDKRQRAALLALALSSLLLRGGERVALLGGGQPPATGKPALRRLALGLDAAGPGPSLPDPEALPRHAALVLFGDFLSPLAEIDRALRRLAREGLRGHLVQVLDPAEESLPYQGRVRFIGLEGEGEMLVSRTEDLRDAYVRRMRAQRQGLGDIARTLGWSFIAHHTDGSPQAALLALYGALARR